MGSYLSFSFSRPSGESIRETLAPVFGGSFFQPVSVGAIEGHDSGDHWFLAGYAHEEFLRIFCERGVPPLASVSLAPSQDAELNAYQQRCADALGRIVPWGWPRSPFEHEDSRVGVTVLEPKHLSEDALGSLTQWIDRFSNAIVYVHGSIALALQKPAESTWSRAFRAVDSSWTAPFLTLRIGAADPDEGRWISISSRVPVWQRQARALGGRVTPEDADANLQGLASFARAMTQGKPGAHLPAELHLEGSIFFREEARIRAAFQDLLG